MGTRTLLAAPSNSTDALFRAWVNEVDAALIAFGWTRSGDTGEATMPTSSTRPTATNLYPLWVVYKMADALQSTTAVYMRIDYGTGGGTDLPAMKIQIAIGGTNGSGTLTGIVTSQKTLAGDVSTTTQGYLRTCGDTSSFALTGWVTGTPNSNTVYRGIAFAIERDRDTSGNNTSSGVNYITFTQAGGAALTASSQYIDAAGGLGTEESKWYGMVTSQSSQSAGGIVGVGPVKCAYGAFRNPMRRMILYSAPDFVNESVNPVVIYGASKNYLMLKAGLAFTSSLNGWMTAGNSGWAMWWE